MTKIRNSAFILGCRASGKTSFLSGLSILSRPSHKSSFGMVVNDERTAIFVKDLKQYADRGDWPPGTSDLIPLDFEVIYKHRTFSLSLLDYPGEDLLDAMETMNYENKELIRDHIVKANIILLLLDPTQDLISPLNTDLAKARRRQDALAAAVGKLAVMRKENGLELPIVGLLISKSDLLDDGQLSQIRVDNKVLFSKLSQNARSPNLSCFPFTASGPVAQGGLYPSKPAPKGFEKLFAWLWLQVVVQRNRRLITAAITVALAIGILLAGWGLFASLIATHVASRVQVETVDNISRLVDKPRIPRKVAKALEARAGAELIRLGPEVGDAKYLEQIRKLVDELRKWAAMPHLSQRQQFSELLIQMAGREDDVLFAAIVNSVQSGDLEDILLKIREYTTRFPVGGKNQTAVSEIQQKALGVREFQLRSEIKGITITSRDSLSTKGTKIMEYLASSQNAQNRDEIQMARDVCARLSGADSVKIVLKACGYEGYSGEKHEIRWLIRNNPVPSATHTSSSKDRQSTSEGKSLEVHSSDWEHVRAEFYVDTGWVRTYMEKTSEAEIRILQDLYRLDGKQQLEINQNGKDWGDIRPWLRAEVLVPASNESGFEPLTPQQLQAYADYVSPGTRW